MVPFRIWDNQYDAVSVTGYVDDFLFIVIDNEDMYDEDGNPLKSIILTENDKNHIFDPVDDAGEFLLKTYGEWAMYHYLKNMEPI